LVSSEILRGVYPEPKSETLPGTSPEPRDEILPLHIVQGQNDRGRAQNNNKKSF
jgi:hypothetical protein